ncbi:MAG: TfoX/Sxy family protein [Paludibacteraceae bacterium]|jgi:Regulator of competence-specific genes|nr:TfoX/Sxy family protein [Paludibacteraceae bacterium]
MSNADLVQYIIEQASQAGEVRARKMFGDYCLYCNDKPVGLICDDYLYLKPLKQLDSVLREDDRQMRPPYDGAKPHYVITDVDDADYVSLLVKTVVENLPSKKR